MVGQPRGMNAALFDGFNCRLNVVTFILPENFGLSGYGGGVSPANESPPQAFPRKHVVFLVRGKTKESNTLPHHPPFPHISRSVGMPRDVWAEGVGFQKTLCLKGWRVTINTSKKRNM